MGNRAINSFPNISGQTSWSTGMKASSPISRCLLQYGIPLASSDLHVGFPQGFPFFVDAQQTSKLLLNGCWKLILPGMVRTTHYVKKFGGKKMVLKNASTREWENDRNKRTYTPALIWNETPHKPFVFHHSIGCQKFENPLYYYYILYKVLYNKRRNIIIK